MSQSSPYFQYHWKADTLLFSVILRQPILFNIWKQPVLFSIIKCSLLISRVRALSLTSIPFNIMECSQWSTVGFLFLVDGWISPWVEVGFLSLPCEVSCVNKDVTIRNRKTGRILCVSCSQPLTSLISDVICIRCFAGLILFSSRNFMWIQHYPNSFWVLWVSLMQTSFTTSLDPKFVPDTAADAVSSTFSISKSFPITFHFFSNFTCSSLGLDGSNDLGVTNEILAAISFSIPHNSVSDSE